MSMRFKTTINKSLLLISCIITAGCVPMPGGGGCDYDTIPTYAVVKDIEDDLVTLELSTQLMPPFERGSTTNIYKEKLPPVHLGELLPAHISLITTGSCTPSSYSLNTSDYFAIKQTVISFSDPDEGWLAPDADKKIESVAKHFLQIKKEYPQAILKLYGHAQPGQGDDYTFALLLHYGNSVKNRLMDEGVDQESMLVLPFDDETKMDFTKALPENRVTFSVELNYI